MAARDYEYKRLGTLFLLARLDLLTGEVIPLVSGSHHSAHTSKETQKYLATKPGRFEFVFTPKHGSWLNLIESFLGKMAKQCLKGIRVNSRQELKERICKYIEKINAQHLTFLLYHTAANVCNQIKKESIVKLF